MWTQARLHARTKVVILLCHNVVAIQNYAGATASKIPPNNPNNPFDLTSAIVVSGLASVSTQHPTDPASPFVVSYDVKDSASPPNKAVTVRRRVQVNTVLTCLGPFHSFRRGS